MQSLKLLNRQKTIFYLGILFLIFCSTWLIAPSINHILRVGPNLISEYEGSSMPSGWLFRIFDGLAFSIFAVGVYLNKITLVRRFGKWFPYLLFAFSALVFIDISTPVNCILANGICAPDKNFAFYIHAVESVLLGAFIFLVSVWAYIKEHRWLWVIILQVVSGATGLVLNKYFDHGLFAIQAMYQIILFYWMYLLVFEDKHRKTKFVFIRDFIAIWVLVNATLSLYSSWHHITFGGLLSTAYFAKDNSWLVAHSFFTGLLLLYLARLIYLGYHRARTIMLWVLLIEVAKYSGFIRAPILTIMFAIPLLILAVNESSFDIKTSYAKLFQRLKLFITGLIIISFIVLIFSLGFKIFSAEQWEKSAFDSARVVKRALLLEYSANKHDPRKARLLSYSLTGAGVAVYSWLIISLIAPFPVTKDKSSATGEEALEKLKKWSESSEDPFKLWPPGKEYWRSDKGYIVAYKRVGGVLYAAADPICPLNQIQNTIKEFKNYCHQNGLKHAWLMINQKSLPNYKLNSLTTLMIGSSSVIDTKQFSEQTSKNKWWRWVNNKQTKSGMQYELLLPPHKEDILDKIELISMHWLDRDNHTERSFLLGYFDRDYLANCPIHALKNSNGSIVGFANQLPQAKQLNRTTIDLMRADKEYEGAMSYLLCQSIKMAYTKNYKEFDLGFVPLSPGADVNRTQNLLLKSVKPMFSSRGLHQFKNKFEPTWEKYYMAWDGDLIDALSIAKDLPKVLKP